MEFDKLEAAMDEYMAMLPDSNTKIHEAEDLQKVFLEAQDLVAKAILELDTDMAEIKGIVKMEFKRAMMEDNPGKTAPEKKACSEADEGFIEADKAKDLAKARIDYLKIKLGIFNDAHLVCRVIAKGAQ